MSEYQAIKDLAKAQHMTNIMELCKIKHPLPNEDKLRDTVHDYVELCKYYESIPKR